MVYSSTAKPSCLVNLFCDDQIVFILSNFDSTSANVTLSFISITHGHPTTPPSNVLQVVDPWYGWITECPNLANGAEGMSVPRNLVSGVPTSTDCPSTRATLTAGGPKLPRREDILHNHMAETHSRRHVQPDTAQETSRLPGVTAQGHFDPPIVEAKHHLHKPAVPPSSENRTDTARSDRPRRCTKGHCSPSRLFRSKMKARRARQDSYPPGHMFGKQHDEIAQALGVEKNLKREAPTDMKGQTIEDKAIGKGAPIPPELKEDIHAAIDRLRDEQKAQEAQLKEDGPTPYTNKTQSKRMALTDEQKVHQHHHVHERLKAGRKAATHERRGDKMQPLQPEESPRFEDLVGDDLLRANGRDGVLKHSKREPPVSPRGSPVASVKHAEEQDQLSTSQEESGETEDDEGEGPTTQLEDLRGVEEY